MEHAIPPRSVHIHNSSHFSSIDFEPLLDSIQAASLLRIHPKTLQKLARRGEIQGTHIGKLWRFRASVLNDWLLRQERAG
jgi:excisionase family DNA binding protein